jgi:hypothetical protein
MDTVRIRFSLGELYGLSCCACACACTYDIGNAFSYEKQKKKSVLLLVLNVKQVHMENIILDGTIY